VQSQKPSIAMMKLALMRTVTGKEDPELPLLQRISSLELTAHQIEAQINASQSSSNRHISTSTVQRRLCESGLHGQIAAKKPQLKDTNKNRLACAKKHEQWTLDWRKSVLWSDESKFDIFGSNLYVFVRRRVDERMISTCVIPTVKHGGGSVMVWVCFSGYTVCDLFRIQHTLNQHGYQSILQLYAIPSGLGLVELSFVFQQDNDPKHTSRLCKGYLTKQESDGAASDDLASTITQPHPSLRWFGMS
jgi:hypothetical protein